MKKTLSRRDFLKSTAAIAAIGAISGPLAACGNFGANTVKSTGDGKMKLTFDTAMLKMAHPFTISGFTRTEMKTILLEISYGGYTGYGEAAVSPSMFTVTIEESLEFLSKVDLEQFSSPFEMDDILTYVDGIAPGFTAAKAGIDIALHDLTGKLLGKPTWELFGYTASKTPDTSFTIGIDTQDMIRQKTLEAVPLYNIIKVKLGVDEATDKMIINTIREVTDKPIIIDANQGWKDKNHALAMINWLSERGVTMIEQPMPKNVFDDMAWITERSPLPTIADESCQRLVDVPKLKGVFNGFNIKLIKCTGLYEARKMIGVAEALGMKLMVGGTTETSCSTAATAQLAPKMDWADLDGSLLISNDMFTGYKIVNGKITLNNDPGLGIKKL